LQGLSKDANRRGIILWEKFYCTFFITFLTAVDDVDDVGDVMNMSLLRAITGALSLGWHFLARVEVSLALVSPLLLAKGW